VVELYFSCSGFAEVGKKVGLTEKRAGEKALAEMPQFLKNNPFLLSFVNRLENGVVIPLWERKRNSLWKLGKLLSKAFPLVEIFDGEEVRLITSQRGIEKLKEAVEVLEKNVRYLPFPAKVLFQNGIPRSCTALSLRLKGVVIKDRKIVWFRNLLAEENVSLYLNGGIKSFKPVLELGLVNRATVCKALRKRGLTLNSKDEVIPCRSVIRKEKRKIRMAVQFPKSMDDAVEAESRKRGYAFGAFVYSLLKNASREELLSCAENFALGRSFQPFGEKKKRRVHVDRETYEKVDAVSRELNCSRSMVVNAFLSKKLGVDYAGISRSSDSVPCCC
jgi:hypothetical protein